MLGSDSITTTNRRRPQLEKNGTVLFGCERELCKRYAKFATFIGSSQIRQPIITDTVSPDEVHLAMNPLWLFGTIALPNHLYMWQ